MPATFKSLNPSDIAFDRDGTLYVTFATNSAEGRDVARVSPDGKIIMVHGLSPVTAIAAGDGGAWFTEADRLGHISREGHFEELPVGPDVRVLGAILVDKNRVWFATRGAIGRLSVLTHAIDFITLPDSESFPNALAVSGNGDVWLTESLDDPRCFSECGGIARIVP
jgi:streptogramin lyase